MLNNDASFNKGLGGASSAYLKLSGSMLPQQNHFQSGIPGMYTNLMIPTSGNLAADSHGLMPNLREHSRNTLHPRRLSLAASHSASMSKISEIRQKR